MYDHREEVDQIVLERKAAGNTAQAKTVAKKKFAVLCDSWWDRRADQLQCAADACDIKKVHQLLREICGPTRRKAICLPMPGWNRTTKTAKDNVEAFQVRFKTTLNQDRNGFCQAAPPSEADTRYP